MSHEIYGYIRVSSKDQNEERQRIAMHEAGVENKNRIFIRLMQTKIDRLRPVDFCMVSQRSFNFCLRR